MPGGAAPGGMGSSAFYVLNLCSLGLAVLTAAVIALAMALRRDLLRRSSLRLQAIIALLDTSRHLLMLVDGDGWADSLACQWVGFSAVLGTHLYALLLAAIAFHLHYVYVLEREMARRTARLLWVMSLLTILTLDLLPLLWGGYDQTARDYHGSAYFVVYGLALCPSAGYCLFVSARVFSKPFVPPSHDFMLDTILNCSRLTSLTRHVQRSVCFVAAYLLVCTLALAGQIIDTFFRHAWTHAWLPLGLAATGTLHFLLVAADPSIRRAMLESAAADELPSIMRHSRLTALHKPVFIATPAVIVTHRQSDNTPLLQFQKVLESCARI